MSTIPLVDLHAQYRSISGEIDAAVRRVIEGAAFILGPEVARFEEDFAAYVGARDAVGVASGTAAIQIALRALGIGPGDEVITTSHTFFATAEAVSNVGAVPVFADIDPVTYTLAPECVEEAVTPRTRAIMPVHLYGQPADLDPLLDIARRHGLALIEDAAQAHGAEYRGRRVGAIGDLGCFSFYPGKNLGAYGDAGAITGNDPELVARARKLRDHGRTSKYEHDQIGLAERMDGLQAAVLGVKLGHLDEWTAARRRVADRYAESLDGSGLVLPLEAPGRRHVYHLYVVRSPHRDRLLESLARAGIAGGIHYPIPVHRQPAYGSTYADAHLPHTDAAAAEVLSLPIYPELDATQVATIVGVIRAEGA